MHPFLLAKLTEASKSKKNDSKFSPKTKIMTKPVQNLFRYSSFKLIILEPCPNIFGKEVTNKSEPLLIVTNLGKYVNISMKYVALKR